MSDEMTRVEWLREKYADEIAEGRQLARRKRYACKGFAAWDGPCGAEDCETCHPGNAVDSWDSEESEDETSFPRRKMVRARKARFVGTAREIRVGDRVEVTSWFTYKVGGERTSYQHWYKRVEKGPAWKD